MRHDWIFDVLEDLRAYAAMNGLHATVTQVDAALRAAQAEVAAGRDTPPCPLAAPLPLSKRPN